MHSPISGTALAIILLLAAFIVVLNISLVFSWKKRHSQPGKGAPAIKLDKSILRPWAEEDRQLEELSQRVQALKKKEDQESQPEENEHDQTA